MPSNLELPYISIANAAKGLRSGDLTSVQLTQLMLDRIAALDGKLNAYITVTADLALDQAKTADDELAAGIDRGPLQGIPFALKDLYDTEGILTTANSRAYTGRIPGADATTTRLLKEAGMVLLGKLVMHEFASGSPKPDCYAPPSRNPWNLDHVPGGSSSGSGTALAAGLCYGSLGSDTGGSIRGPAAHCSIVGIKPTFGLVSRTGVVPLSWSLDHAGPMARTVEDCALILQAIAGYDPTDPWSAKSEPVDYVAKLGSSIAGKRLGVPDDWIRKSPNVSAEVIAAFDAAVEVFKGLGAEIVPIDSTGFINARDAGNIVIVGEAYSFHEKRLMEDPSVFGTGVVNRMREGAFVTSADYLQAQKARLVYNGQIAAAMAGVDAVISPTIPNPPLPFDGVNPESNYVAPSFMTAFNVSGLPAISIPGGFSSTGLPIGLQVAGHAFEEDEVFAIAAAYEAATQWHTMFPEVK